MVNIFGAVQVPMSILLIDPDFSTLKVGLASIVTSPDITVSTFKLTSLRIASVALKLREIIK